MTSLFLIPLEDIKQISSSIDASTGRCSGTLNQSRVFKFRAIVTKGDSIALDQSKPSYRFPNTGAPRLISRQQPRPVAGQAFHRDHGQN